MVKFSIYLNRRGFVTCLIWHSCIRTFAAYIYTEYHFQTDRLSFLADVPPEITDTDDTYLDTDVARAGVLMNTVNVTDIDTPIITNLTVTMTDPTSKFNLVPTKAGCKYKFAPQ